MDLIGTIHQVSRGTYGAPRVHAELVCGQGVTIGHNTVSLLMRRAGLAGLPARTHARGASGPRGWSRSPTWSAATSAAMARTSCG
jgi:hypothetical protein